MMKRVKVFSSAVEGKKSAKATFSAKICVRLKNGEILETEKDHAKGSPAFPLTMEEICAKFLDCSQGILPAQKAREVIQMLETFETLSEVRKLMGILLEDIRLDSKGLSME